MRIRKGILTMFLCLLAHNLLYPKYHRTYRLTISRAAIKVSGQPIQIKPPKDYEVRTVTVNEHCIELVKMLREHYEREKARLGSKWAGDEWLFTQWNGEIMNPQTPTKQFDKFLKKHGLKHSSCTRSDIHQPHCSYTEVSTSGRYSRG